MHYAQKAADMGRASSPILAPSIGRGCRAQRGGAHSRLLNIRLPSYRHPERSPRSFLHDGMHHIGASTVTTPWCCLSLLSLAPRLSVCQKDFSTSLEIDDTQKTASPHSSPFLWKGLPSVARRGCHSRLLKYVFPTLHPLRGCHEKNAVPTGCGVSFILPS